MGRLGGEKEREEGEEGNESEEGKEITDRNGVGFRVGGFWDKVININECHLQEEPSNAIRKSARDYALAHQLEFLLYSILLDQI